MSRFTYSVAALCAPNAPTTVTVPATELLNLLRFHQQRVAVIEYLRMAAGGSAEGRWLDSDGCECGEDDEGADFTPYAPEDQQGWIDTLAGNAQELLDQLEPHREVA